MIGQISMFENQRELLVKKTIDRILFHEREDGYYFQNSGGKDSSVVRQLLIETKVKHDSHYNITGVDPAELVYHIRDNNPETKLHQHEKSIYQLIVEKLFPPTRKVRYCCDLLKERGGSGRIVVTGVRAAESPNRKNWSMFGSCSKEDQKFIFNPILDWTDDDVWWFICDREIKECNLYYEGFQRIGCIGCPKASKKNRMYEFKRYPKVYENYLRAFKRMLDNRKLRDKETKWTDPEQVMTWWLEEDKRTPVCDGQCKIFD